MEQIQIFISYAREDSAEVIKLYRWLESEGFKPWMDTVADPAALRVNRHGTG